MKAFEDMEYHPLTEQVVNILLDKTQSDNVLFYRLLVSFYFTKVASMMRCSVASPDRGPVPVNMYVLNLAPSGTGKGHSSTIMEKVVTDKFREKFLEETFPALASINMLNLANRRAAKKGTDPEAEAIILEKDFERIGPLLFSFESGTGPAVKQMRNKLLMANAGALNLMIDEIGSNLISNMEVLESYLDLFDVGSTKQKLIKNTTDNQRTEEIVGVTPTNLLMFGTPVKLMDGGKTEEALMSLLETGYGRRCFFGYVRNPGKKKKLTPKEVYDIMTSAQANQFLNDLSDKLANLADIINANKVLTMDEPTALELIEYKLHCETLAEDMPEHAEIRKAEMSHRYFKVLKLAGAYAFVDDSPSVTMDHLHNAIKLAELSGQAFEQLLTRDRPYVKLAKYLGSCKTEVTHADMIEDLPFYRGSQSQRNDMLQLATAWGCKNNIIIKKAFQDGIEFLRGETLKATDLERMTIAYSADMTTGYRNERAPFEKLYKLTQTSGLHWVSHHLNGGYRNEDNAIPGFDLLVIDVDSGINLSTAKLLLKDYKALYYTTKSHTDTDHRFRILLPMTHRLEMDAKDYKEFMNNIFEWLPFKADESGNHRCKKWLSHTGNYEYTEGALFDCLPFIPKTSKNEERKQLLNSQHAMDNLERWFINNTGDGNRNKMLHRYSMLLIDAGYDFEGVRLRVTEFNNKLPDKLDEVEIMSTVMVSVSKALAKK